MSRPVPAATGALRVLRYLGAQATPVPAVRIAEAIGMPRSSTYHLLNAMAQEGFVTHFADDGRWGIGIAAYEVGVGYARQQPVARLARIPLASLVDRVGESAHLAMLRGREVVYVLEERAPGKPPLVTDVDVRLPAHLTATGRAILATLPAAQVRALFPDTSAFVSRTGVGPTRPSELRVLLQETRHRGYAVEDGEVTAGFASVAVPILEGTAAYASVAATYRTEEEPDRDALVEAVSATATEVARRLRGRTR